MEEKNEVKGEDLKNPKSVCLDLEKKWTDLWMIGFFYNM